MGEIRRAVPVNGGFNGEIVLHENLEGVVFVGFDERTRMLTVDQIDRAGDSICDTSMMDLTMWLLPRTGSRLSLMDS
jgi:hypothetical protein